MSKRSPHLLLVVMVYSVDRPSTNPTGAISRPCLVSRMTTPSPRGISGGVATTQVNNLFADARISSGGGGRALEILADAWVTAACRPSELAKLKVPRGVSAFD